MKLRCPLRPVCVGKTTCETRLEGHRIRRLAKLRQRSSNHICEPSMCFRSRIVARSPVLNFRECGRMSDSRSEAENDAVCVPRLQIKRKRFRVWHKIFPSAPQRSGDTAKSRFSCWIRAFWFGWCQLGRRAPRRTDLFSPVVEQAVKSRLGNICTNVAKLRTSRGCLESPRCGGKS